MKSKAIPLCIIVIVVTCCLFTVSCTAKSSIVGYWQDTKQKNLYLEFTNDGKCIIDGPDGIHTDNYELVSEHYIQFETAYLGIVYELGVGTIRYELSGDTLKLGNDNTKTFKRLRK